MVRRLDEAVPEQTLSYMEVAVITSSTFRVGLLVTGFALAGCTQQLVSHNRELREQGSEQFAEHHYADAAGTFREAARQDPRDYKALYSLGVCCEKMGQTTEAIQAYKSSLDSQSRTLPGQADDASRLRTTDALASLIARADPRDGEIDLVEKHAQKTQSAADYFLLAKIYRYRGDADSAVNAYNHAMIKDPKDFTIAKEFGLYMAQLGQNDRAEAPLRKAYALKPNDVEVNQALRNIGVVPGPALKDKADLVPPPVPEGPIPAITDLKLPNFGNNPNAAANPSAQPAAQTLPPPAPAD
jgi:Flp pilus assembly protein TadD